jgi:hypothetical protein
MYSLMWAGIMCTYGDCSISVRSAVGEPVVNAPVSLYNLSTGGLLLSNTTDAAGHATFPVSCEDTNLSVSYAVSEYSAVLSNASASSTVPMSGFLTGKVQIKNTLGSYIEGADCSVTALENGTVVHDFGTQCKVKPGIDCSGIACNYLAPSDCAFSDSQGWYYFSSQIDEGKNFIYGRTYELRFVCNGQNTSSYFTVGLSKAPDTDYMGDWIQRYNGIIFLVVVALVLCVLLLAGLGWISSKGKKRNKGF